MIKKYFIPGLVILLPVILTLIIVGFLVNILTQPFIGPLTAFFEESWSNKTDNAFLIDPTIIKIVSQVIVFFLLILFTIFIGFIGRLLLIEYLFGLGDKILHLVPFFNKIYKASKSVVHSLFSPTSKTFSKVVFVPFPSTETLSLGLITKESLTVQSHSEDSLVPVFVPGTPNPSMGFMLMFREEQIISVNMRVEDALKFVISCGVVMSDFKVDAPLNQFD